jgi:hypothetical protein
MARRLPRWHWVRIVMQVGPRIASVRSVLFALSVRMDESGECYPSQSTIAADTAMGERTVRDSILEARRTAWLAVVDHIRPGQAWRRSHYVACVPDSLNLADVDLGRDVDLEHMADTIGSQYGDVQDRMHGTRRRLHPDRAKSRHAKGAAAIAARSKGEKAKGAAKRSMKVRQLTTEGAANDSKKVRPLSPTKFPSEVPINTFGEGRIASDAPDRVKDAQGQNQEPGTQPQPATPSPNGSARRTIPPEVLHGIGIPKPEPKPKRDLAPSIRKLLEAGETPDAVQKILASHGCTLQDVREAMA